MAKPQISVENLRKVFRTTKRDPDRGWWSNTLRPTRTEVVAVEEVSFSVQAGERVAFLGPNGAGKSTTIKMLTGILYPTSGAASVCGLSPQEDRRRLAMMIGTLFGQRTQLLANLPVQESFALQGAIYGISPAATERRAKKLIEQFDLGRVAGRATRQLSLGERMRAEIAVALLHKPKVLFLDEPTIGLDVIAKRALRTALLDLNREEGVTLFVTSHDPTDVEVLCERVMVVNHGKLIVDMPTAELRKKYLTHKQITLQTVRPLPTLTLPGVAVTSTTPDRVTMTVDTAQTSLDDVLRQLLEVASMVDVDVHDPSMEEVIRTIYEAA